MKKGAAFAQIEDQEKTGHWCAISLDSFLFIVLWNNSTRTLSLFHLYDCCLCELVNSSHDGARMGRHGKNCAGSILPKNFGQSPPQRILSPSRSHQENRVYRTPIPRLRSFFSLRHIPAVKD